jgi:hypothetical protein
MKITFKCSSATLMPYRLKAPIAEILFGGWAARNLLELEIWTRYVLRKGEYAERFAKD